MSATPSRSEPAPAEPRPAGMLLRLAAMAYEAVLLFGVVFVVSYALLALVRWSYPLAGYQRLVLQAVLFVTLGAYFVYQWHKTGQTLAMKSWHLRVLDATGKPPTRARAVGRYVGAWHLVLPGMAFAALYGGNPFADLIAVAAGALLLMLPALVDPQRRLLHDRLSRTVVVRER